MVGSGHGLLLSAKTEPILGAFFQVYNALGPGFLERVYENALTLELRERGLRVEQQPPVSVSYKGVCVGQYFADLVVEGLVIVELKAAEALCDAHAAQLVNYLRATQLEVGLLLNFGRTATFRRVILTNNRKQAATQPKPISANP
jgi:GxxExxY protein